MVNYTGPPLDIIFFGNVGVGKSTLISNVSGAPFSSGVSFASGKIPDKTFADDKKGRDIRWFDTAGLSDVKQAEKAATIIQTALQEAADKKRGAKLIFVVNLISGRLDNNTVFTIKKVLNSIKLPNDEEFGDNKYAVVVNKITKKVKEGAKFKNQGRFELESCFQKSESLKYSTDHIFYVLKDDEMEDEEDAKFSDEGALNELEKILLVDVPTVESIVDADLINTDEMEKQLADAAIKFQKELDRQKAEFDGRLDDIQEEFNEKARKRDAKHKKDMDNLRNEHIKDKKELKGRFDQMEKDNKAAKKEKEDLKERIANYQKKKKTAARAQEEWAKHRYGMPDLISKLSGAATETKTFSEGDLSIKEKMYAALDDCSSHVKPSNFDTGCMYAMFFVNHTDKAINIGHPIAESGIQKYCASIVQPNGVDGTFTVSNHAGACGVLKVSDIYVSFSNPYCGCGKVSWGTSESYADCWQSNEGDSSQTTRKTEDGFKVKISQAYTSGNIVGAVVEFEKA